MIYCRRSVRILIWWIDWQTPVSCRQSQSSRRTLRELWRNMQETQRCRISYKTSVKLWVSFIAESCRILEWRTVYALKRGIFWCLFPELQSNEGNEHQNNSLVSAWTVRHKSTNITLFPIPHNECINDDKKDDLHTSSLCLSLALRSADDVTVDCLWRHNNQTIVTRACDKWHLTH